MLDERVDNEFRDTDSTNYSDEESYIYFGLNDDYTPEQVAQAAAYLHGERLSSLTFQ